MVVLVLTAVPAGLRGHVTRWLLEISPGVFVGALPRRVRDELWDRVIELCRDGRAVMVESARTEQGLAFRVHRPDWEPVDLDGLRRFNENFGKGMVARYIERSPLPFGRHRWVAASGPPRARTTAHRPLDREVSESAAAGATSRIP